MSYHLILNLYKNIPKSIHFLEQTEHTDILIYTCIEPISIKFNYERMGTVNSCHCFLMAAKQDEMVTQIRNINYNKSLSILLCSYTVQRSI